MGIEVLIENLTRILTKVPSFSSSVQEPRSEDHDSLACGLLQLNLDRVKFPIDDVDHSVNLLRSNWPSPGLLTKKVHDMCGELFAAL